MSKIYYTGYYIQIFNLSWFVFANSSQVCFAILCEFTNWDTTILRLHFNEEKIFKILGVVLGIYVEPAQVSKTSFPPFSKIGTEFDVVVHKFTDVSGVIGDNA